MELFFGFMAVPLIDQFGQVEHSISGTIFLGPVEDPLIESPREVPFMVAGGGLGGLGAKGPWSP